MKTESKPKITKDSVPEDFTLLLALTDSLPVIFFGASMLLIGRRFSSPLFMAGALLCLIGGAMTSFPSVIFFAAGLLGMVLMTVFAFILDSADPRANWIEQLTNGVAQAAFFMGILLLK